MIAFTGSFFPFSAAEITRRYGEKAGYLTRVRAASAQLARSRLLLESDIEKIVGRAAELWDNLAAQRR
jgi:hypothetical protein